MVYVIYRVYYKLQILSFDLVILEIDLILNHTPRFLPI